MPLIWSSAAAAPVPHCCRCRCALISSWCSAAIGRFPNCSLREGEPAANRSVSAAAAASEHCCDSVCRLFHVKTIKAERSWRGRRRKRSSPAPRGRKHRPDGNSPETLLRPEDITSTIFSMVVSETRRERASSPRSLLRFVKPGGGSGGHPGRCSAGLLLRSGSTRAPPPSPQPSKH